MLRSLEIILAIVMVVAATITYSIKHKAQLKLEQVHKLEAEIKLERDTIELLKADWSLMTQPSRLQKLIDVYSTELQLKPTEPTSIVHLNELPMLKKDIPADAPGGDPIAAAIMHDGAVPDLAKAKPAEGKVAAAKPLPSKDGKAKPVAQTLAKAGKPVPLARPKIALPAAPAAAVADGEPQDMEEGGSAIDDASAQNEQDSITTGAVH